MFRFPLTYWQFILQKLMQPRVCLSTECREHNTDTTSVQRVFTTTVKVQLGDREIFVKFNGPPPRYEPYRLSPFKRNVLKNELDKIMKNDIIEESESPFAAPGHSHKKEG